MQGRTDQLPWNQPITINQLTAVIQLFTIADCSEPADCISVKKKPAAKESAVQHKSADCRDSAGHNESADCSEATDCNAVKKNTAVKESADQHKSVIAAIQLVTMNQRKALNQLVTMHHLLLVMSAYLSESVDQRCSSSI